MEQKPAELSGANFEFIHVTGSSSSAGKERRRNNYLARAHAAKVNRQNSKVNAENRRAKDVPGFVILPKPTEPKLTSGEKNSIVSDPEDTTGDDSTLSFRRTMFSKRKLEREAPKDPEQRSPPQPSTFAPDYGGLHIDTFDFNAEPHSARMGQYCTCYLLEILN